MVDLEERVLLIDIDSLIYYGASKDDLIDGISCVDNRMSEIIRDNKCDNVVSFMSTSKTFRHGFARTKPYKYNRKDLVKPEWFNDIKSYIKGRYNVYTYDNLEADDCVSYFGTKFTNATICSIDKDVLKQCAGKNYSYQIIKCKKTGYWSIKGFVNTSKKDAEKFLWCQALAGDSTDGITGIERVGMKTAEGWVSTWKPEDYHHKAMDKYVDKYGLVEGINRFTETFRLVYLLKNDEDMIREIGKIIELPTPKKIVV